MFDLFDMCSICHLGLKIEMNLKIDIESDRMETHQNALGTRHRTSERKKNERANIERNMMSEKEASEKKGIGMKRRSARIGIHRNG